MSTAASVCTQSEFIGDLHGVVHRHIIAEHDPRFVGLVCVRIYSGVRRKLAGSTFCGKTLIGFGVDKANPFTAVIIKFPHCLTVVAGAAKALTAHALPVVKVANAASSARCAGQALIRVVFRGCDQFPLLLDSSSSAKAGAVACVKRAAALFSVCPVNPIKDASHVAP